MAVPNNLWVYDNPDTNCRELFNHGHLIIHFPAIAFGTGHWYPTGENRWVQQMYYDDMRKLGPFDEGTEYGDRIHKPFDPLATEIVHG